MQLLMSSTGCQFVIPVYQRNYTWSAEREVKQYLNDLGRVLKQEYKNHFMGILIYLEKSIDFSTRELSVIDGQQRLTTTFLTIYAIREMFKNSGELDRVQQLDGQYLTNPYHKDKIKYKLKPLVADDDVYRCIVEDRLADNENQQSLIYKNYIYIRNHLEGLVANGYTANDILLALDKLYVVCVPISEEDNAQKIFESINATGVKLTAADLIRNFLLMNLDSDTQDQYYAQYWRKIEENISTDSKDLEMFFRMYLAIKTYTLVPKNGVYRSFVDWVESKKVSTDVLFKELLNYAKIYHSINNTPVTTLDKALRVAITDFRKIKSDLPISIIIEFYRLYNIGSIKADVLGQLIQAINAYLIRRNICDMDSQNISKLFPTILRRVMEKCNGDYSDIVAVLNQEMVGNNAGTSGSYMPTDTQMHDALFNANVYGRPTLRIILDRLELSDNPAPVDLSTLSIEHLMPQTPTEEWLEELDVDEETYMANLHRLGNLTLAAKPDNSKMSNQLWDYKNEILKSTAHLKMNMELLSVPKWTIKCIDDRTGTLIKRICELFPYPEVDVSATASAGVVDERTGLKVTVAHMFSSAEEVRKNGAYTTDAGTKGYILLSSKMYPEGDKEKFWFGYRLNRFDLIDQCQEQYCVLICRNKTTLIVNLPRTFLDSVRDNCNSSVDDEGNVRHYHIVIHKHPDGKVTLLLSKPYLKKIDISNYVVAEI
ncbi:MAG: DUF262 domain-containing protein [Oscillospiraceae bacterium]|nr:DUF262 domain-containing protein [Oscillospiraceae bacterium]